MAHLMVSFHLSTVCYQVASLFTFFFVFSSNLDIKRSTRCGFCNVSKCHAERSPTLLSTTRFSLKRYVGRLWGASNKGWFAHLRLFTTEFVKTSCDLSRRDNTPWDTGEFHIFATFFAHHFFLIGTKNF
ncbi:hypothetical protein IscW_ISCW003475 [Ixodes scapularis]|uniref:Uncharacterized protein n=1 Tax=Ixodes scapularis TaxID=6945 RepID=B7PKA2_IXOSC|nr:hypothetical protein IscW_ISCW003475 [Ixodes scapularis]|eukprot:XP_002409813.1 hypothetical protein IscW_ISCW003475 [Ixodes scapularis]